MRSINQNADIKRYFQILVESLKELLKESVEELLEETMKESLIELQREPLWESLDMRIFLENSLKKQTLKGTRKGTHRITPLTRKSYQQYIILFYDVIILFYNLLFYKLDVGIGLQNGESMRRASQVTPLVILK